MYMFLSKKRNNTVKVLSPEVKKKTHIELNCCN